MNAWTGAALFGLSAAVFSLVRSPFQERKVTVVITGDTEGYLSPCGCTEPMTGGIRRMATVVRRLEASSNVVLLDTGGLGGSQGSQSDYKAETNVEALASLDVAAIAWTRRDVALGPQALAAALQLAPGRFVGHASVTGLADNVERGPFLIGAAVEGADIDALVARARGAKKVAILMIDQPRDEAIRIARLYPALGAVVYRRGGWPPDDLERVGNVALFTPGEQGKAIVQAVFANGRFVQYKVTRLDPSIPDDPAVSRFYRTYLRRVNSAGFLNWLPREPSSRYAGSHACASCHAGAAKVWLRSGHAHAYATLETLGHARDPDCVSCHVVGLTANTGFLSRRATPDLASVGCESCHGPAADHADAPRKYRLAKLTRNICETCHAPEQSPNFSFPNYWAKIAH